MYVAKIDADIIGSKEVRELRNKYTEKFGEFFLCFNYSDFRGKDGKCPGQVYKETLEKAVEADEPYRVVSHRYDVFDH